MGCLNSKPVSLASEGVVVSEETVVKKPRFFKRLFRRNKAGIPRAPEPKLLPTELDEEQGEEEMTEIHFPDDYQIRLLLSCCRSLDEGRNGRSEVLGARSESHVGRGDVAGVDILNAPNPALLNAEPEPVTEIVDEEAMDEERPLTNSHLQLLQSRCRSLCRETGERGDRAVDGARSEPDLNQEKKKPKVMAMLTETWERLQRVLQKEHEDEARKQKVAAKKTKKASKKQKRHRASRKGDKKQDQHAAMAGYRFGEDHWLSDVSLD